LAVVVLIAVLASSLVAGKSRSFEFVFGAGKDAQKDSRFVQFFEGPCGIPMLARVQSIPPYDPHASIQSEVVLELTPDGRELRRWPVPVNTVPKALAGDRLLIVISEDGLPEFWITPQGRISAVKGQLTVPDSVRNTCVVATELQEPTYSICGEFVDLKTKRHRTLGYQDLCT
jgi:hypothetical protein